MEIPGRNTSADATGVSRSGRVRKKSSKLADFESPDEIDTRFKRKTDRPQKSQKMMKVGPSMGADVYDDSDSYIDDDLIEVKDEPLEVDDWVDNDDGDDDMCDDGENMDDTNDALHVDDDSTDMPRETSNYSLAQSLYFSEKQGKKNIMLKDGQVVRRKKAQRKDKGKSRFTAYMLWAREIRPGIIQANPNMDFSAVNKRLGELWALVPTTQKYNWKRRAKRLAAKGNQKGSMISTGKAAKQSQNAARSNLINKGGVKPQQVIRTPSKQSEGQSAPATTHKAHTTPKSVAIHKLQAGTEEVGHVVSCIMDNERKGPQEAEISSQVTARSIVRKEDRKLSENRLTALTINRTEEVEEAETMVPVIKGVKGGVIRPVKTLKFSSVCELLLHHNYARSPKDPLRVVCEPLLDNMQSSINVVHVCEKFAQDKQVTLDNEKDLPSTRLVDDCDVDSKDCINVTSQNITSGGIQTIGETPGIKLEQTICEDILPSQSFEPKDVCYVKLETSTVEDLKNDTAEFPSVYTACENSTEEHVLPSLSWELEKTRDEHCVVMDAFDCPNTCNCEKIVCDGVPSPCDCHKLDTDDADEQSVGGCSSPETYECVCKHARCEQTTSVAIHKLQAGEEEAGHVVYCIMDNERKGPQEAEISSQVTARSIGRKEDRELSQNSLTALTINITEEVEEEETTVPVHKGVKGGVILPIWKFVKKELPLIINEIFSEMKTRYRKCCPKILEAALRSLLAQQVTLPKASEFYCISMERLSRNMEILSRLKRRDSPHKFFSSLECMINVSDSDKFIEWMLRMRKIGRLPVTNDKYIIKQYLGLSCYPNGITEFLNTFGEKKSQSETLCTMTNYHVWKWMMMFKKYLFDHYSIYASKLLVKENSSRIFNCVEMVLSFTCIRNRVIIYRGSKNAYSFVCPRTRGRNVMVTFSAAGVYLKPLFLQKGYDMPKWNDPEFIDQSQFHTAASENGELDPLIFLTWLRLFNTELAEHRIEKPVLLLLHGHPCHASLAASTFCQEEGIILYSHYHTPFNAMDPFSRMLTKFHSNYERSLNVIKNYIGKANLSEKYFPVIFLDAWNKMEDKDLAMNAFKESGLIPFNVPIFPLSSKDNISKSKKSIEVPYPLKLCCNTKIFISRLEFERVPQVELPYKLWVPPVPESSVDEPMPLEMNDPLEVCFEPLLQSNDSHHNIVHVYGKSEFDEQQVICDNDNCLPREKMKEDFTDDCKQHIIVMKQDIIPGSSSSTLPRALENTGSTTTGTPVDISGIKREQITCEDFLPSESYKSQGLCDVKLESSSVETIESNTDEFEQIFIKCESPKVEDVSSSPLFDFLGFE